MPRVFTQTFGVAGAIIEKDGKILLIKEAQPNHPDNGKWNHPAGWIDIGEDPVAAAKREVKEETGYDFSPKKLLGVYSFVRTDIKDKFNRQTPHAIKLIFTGDIGETQSKLSLDSSEVKWFSPEEIYSMDRNTLRDVDIKTMVKNFFEGKGVDLFIIHHTIQ